MIKDDHGTQERRVGTELGFETFEVQLPTVRGVYSAVEFERREPEKFALCVRALALGYKVDAIRRALGVAWETVRAVRDRKGTEIREVKKALAGLCFGIAERGLEELMADDKRMARLDAVQIGILIDKGLLLTGEATSIVERREGLPALEGLMASLREVGAGLGAGMGLEEGKGFAMGLAAPGEGLGVAPGSGPVREAEWVELGHSKDSECGGKGA